MSKHSHIGLDFDDTLMPTRAAIVEHLNAVHGTSKSLESLTEYRFVHEWGLTDLDFTAMFNQQEAAFHQRTPLPGVLETLGQWKKDGTFYVITGRPDFWLPSAQAWLDRHQIPIARIHSAPHAGDKSRFAKQEGITLFIEDNPKVALELANNGIDVILLDAPYNQHCSHPRVSRVNHWFDIQSLGLDGTVHERNTHESQV